jgi:uncharacterized protein
MPRPLCCRKVSGQPLSALFKPRGIPAAALEAVTLTVDEFEAVRLADLEGLYQEQAASRMGVSRPTFGRIVETAHRKIADALVHGKALEIRGGNFEMAIERHFLCLDCAHRWQLPYGTGRPAACPECRSGNIQRAPEDRGRGRRNACARGGFGMMHGGRGNPNRGPQANPTGGRP